MPGPSRRILLTAVLPLALPHLARAEPRADRAIRLIVPVAPGGSQDLVARLSARGLSDALGVPVAVENLPGGGSTIGYAAAARAAPDGHTLLAGSDTLSITGALTPRLPLDPLAFAAVHRTVRVPQILVVRAATGAEEAGTWLDGARARAPAVGTPGSGSLAHLLVEQLSRATDATWTHVPYRGGAQAVADLLAGVLDAVMINIGAVTDHVRAGRLRGLLVSPETRSLALPHVPTFAEAGFAGLAAVGWHGLVAPPGTPEPILARLNAASRAVVKLPEVAGRLAGLGVEPTDEPPDALAHAMRADAARYAEVVRRYDVRAG